MLPNPAIPGLRGLAALLVLGFHLAAMEPGQQVFHRLLSLLFSRGWLGVELFFIISGFVIAWTLHHHDYRPSQAHRFLGRRLLRLHPPYLAALGLALLINVDPGLVGYTPRQLATPANLLLHLGYLSDVGGRLWINPVFWSLAVEVQFYLLMAVMAPWLLGSHALKRRGLMLALLLAHGVLPLRGQLTAYLPLFMLGIVVCQYQLQQINSRECWVWTLGLLLFTVPFSKALPPLAVFTVVMLLLRWSMPRPLAWVGQISYSLYLVHYPITMAVMTRLGPDTEPFTVGIAAMAAVVLSVLAAWGCYHWVECPAWRWSQRLNYRVVPSSIRKKILPDSP